MRRVDTNARNYLEVYEQYLIDFIGVSPEAVELVEAINGYNEMTFDDILYVKCAYHDLEQVADCDEDTMDYLEELGIVYDDEDEEDDE